MMDDNERKLLFVNVVLTALILVVGIYYAVQTTAPVHLNIGGGSDIFKPLLSSINQHPEVKDYTNATPTVAKISDADLQFAKQNNITFFDNAKAGDYLLTYPGMQLVYDIDNDKVVNYFEQARAPADLLQKLYAHPEAANYTQTVPTVTKLDDQVLNAAKANNQQFFDLARSGDYLLEWADYVMLYDYNNDRVINTAPRVQLPADFVQKLTAHPETSGYANQNPTITQLTADQIAQGKQANAQLFANAKAGDYLLQWADLVLIYDYNADKIVATFKPQTAPADFLTKLTAHTELSSYAGETPRVSIITQDALPQLKQQFPNLYSNAKAGDYVVRYTGKLVIYNYESNKIVDIFDLQPDTAGTQQ